MSWIHYLLEANCYLGVFYLLYYFIFRRETSYQLNRAYLLISSVASFIIPFVQLGFLKTAPQIAVKMVTGATMKPLPLKHIPVVINTHWQLNDYVLTAYFTIVLALLINLCLKIVKLFRLSQQYKATVVDSYKLVEAPGEADAYSFFNYLFINPKLAFKQTIIHHELIHIQQKHSWDILFIELIKILNWFNPIVYLLQYSIKELHEFIADSETVKAKSDTATYTDFLVNTAYGLGSSTLTSTFFNKSLLKNRIIMLHQKPSGSLARLKYLVIAPLCAALLCASTLAFSKTYGWINLAPGRETTAKINDPYDAFYKQLGKFIRYAADARANSHSGVLVAIFTVNSAGKAQDITIVSKLSERMNGEVQRVLQISDASPLTPETKYAIPIHFEIEDKDGKQVGDENDGKPNIVEIAQNNGAKLLKEIVVVSYK